jgi:nicotinate-nucleotide adenylyltransferase
VAVKSVRRRVGIFGGAFDPPHSGHVALAQAAVAQLRLDELRILPTGQAWHKARVLTEGHQRVAMAELAFGDVPRVILDTREVRRPGPTYTIDTLREVQREQPGAQLLLVIGADQAEALHTWQDAREIPRIAILSIAARARPVSDAPPADISRLPPGFYQPIDLPPFSVSSTEIRARVAAGQPIEGLVTPAVARYIAEHSLYQRTNVPRLDE